MDGDTPHANISTFRLSTTPRELAVHSLDREPGKVFVSNGPAAIWERPEHARLIACVVASSAYLEYEIGLSFGRLLGQTAPLGISIYAAIESDGAKHAALKAAATHTLGPKDLRIFRAVLSYARAATVARNRVVHDLWAYSVHLPDKALLASTRDLMGWASEVAGHIQAMNAKTPKFEPPPVFARRHIKVYGVRDLQRIYDDLVNANRLLAWFWQMKASPPRKRPSGRRRLIDSPALKRWLPHPRSRKRTRRR